MENLYRVAEPYIRPLNFLIFYSVRLMSTHIPETFDEWRHCIEQECRIVLTKEYIEQRLAILRELNHEETQRFIRHYGEHHWQQVVRWFERAQI